VSAGPRASAYLVRGDDPSLVAQEVRALLAGVVGDRDHALVVEEIGGAPADEPCGRGARRGPSPDR
jgi:hypothetical protein